MTQRPLPGSPKGPPHFRDLTVLRTERITPNMLRVTIGGEALAGFQPAGPATHFKMFFPQPGFDHTIVPVNQGDGQAVMPAGIDRPQSRTYTPRRMDLSVLELDVDFVLHGEGVGSTWAANAKVGDHITIAGPGRSFFKVDPEVDWHVIAGDETALPAIETILNALPASATAQVFAEVAEPGDEQALPSPAPVTFSWLHRPPGTTMPGMLLARMLEGVELPAIGRGSIYVACEAAIMRDIRTHFIKVRGVSPAQLTTRGYWKRGAVAYPDNDYGEDRDSN